MNYETELKTMEHMQSQQWFTPNAGKYVITIKTEGEPYTREWEGQEVEKIRFDINVDGHDMVWGVPKGKSFSSLWGQLVLIAQSLDPKGKMVGKRITLVVSMNAGKRSYTVVEALGLIPTKVEEVKA